MAIISNRKVEDLVNRQVHQVKNIASVNFHRHITAILVEFVKCGKIVWTSEHLTAF